MRERLQTQLKKASRRGGTSALNEIREELNKISWPLKEELKFCTQVVIGATFVFGIGIYMSDLVVKGVLDGIQFLSKMIFG